MIRRVQSFNPSQRDAADGRKERGRLATKKERMESFVSSCARESGLEI